jgi:hypothetical protein
LEDGELDEDKVNAGEVTDFAFSVVAGAVVTSNVKLDDVGFDGDEFNVGEVGDMALSVVAGAEVAVNGGLDEDKFNVVEDTEVAFAVASTVVGNVEVGWDGVEVADVAV